MTEPRTTTNEERHREELLREHAVQRGIRDHAPLGSEVWQAAATRIGEIEVEIARIERAMDPPRG